MNENVAPPDAQPSSYDRESWIWVSQPHIDPPIAPGKWLVFVYPHDVDHWWSRISGGVLAGKLGPIAKVATARKHVNDTQSRVICVYTRDWHDTDDVRRVLTGLRELGITWRLSYKTDEATREGHYGRGAAKYVSQPASNNFDQRH